MPPITYRYHHTGIPTTDIVEGMVHIPHLHIWATDHESNPFGIQWMKYDDDCTLPALVRQVAHVAFQVDNLAQALVGKKILIAPNSPSAGVTVAFIEEAGAPVELLEYAKISETRLP